jgi:hypothetical protein
MNTETFFRWAFLFLTLGIFGVRGYFGQLARRQGNASYTHLQGCISLIKEHNKLYYIRRLS